MPTARRSSFYSKPDHIFDTLELRRLTANKEYTGKNPTDFYELYWQHLMTGTTFAHIQAWLGKLLLRRPDSVPRRLRLALWSMWALIILAIVSLSVYAVCLGRLPVVEGMGAVVLFFLVRPLERFGLKYVGDAARYLSPFPENVGIRHAIRSTGLPLLRGLHRDPLRRYDRIIVVGHSLGSVIAYDVLTYLWQEMHSKVERSPQRHGKPELARKNSRRAMEGRRPRREARDSPERALSHCVSLRASDSEVAQVSAGRSRQKESLAVSPRAPGGLGCPVAQS
jgi:hypothetical protein